MLRKIHLRASRTTQPKLLAAGKHLIVTWNTGSIEQVRTRRIERVERSDGREVLLLCTCAALALFVVASMAFVLWWLSQYALR